MIVHNYEFDFNIYDVILEYSFNDCISFLLKLNINGKKKYKYIDKDFFMYVDEIENLFKKHRIPIVTVNCLIKNFESQIIICKKYITNIRNCDWCDTDPGYAVKIDLIDDDKTVIQENMLIDTRYMDFYEKYNKMESAI